MENKVTPNSFEVYEALRELGADRRDASELASIFSREAFDGDFVLIMTVLEQISAARIPHPKPPQDFDEPKYEHTSPQKRNAQKAITDAILEGHGHLTMIDKVDLCLRARANNYPKLMMSSIARACGTEEYVVLQRRDFLGLPKNKAKVRRAARERAELERRRILR